MTSKMVLLCVLTLSFVLSSREVLGDSHDVVNDRNFQLQILTRLATLTSSQKILEDKIDHIKAQNMHLELGVLKTKVDCLFDDSRKGVVSNTNVGNMEANLGQLRSDIEMLKRTQSQAHQISKGRGGATFNRWGRVTCPQDSTVVYKGFTGGNPFTPRGSGSSLLCLPEDPIYSNFTVDENNLGLIYGTEYNTINSPIMQNLHSYEMVCVVCVSQRRRSLIMLPARNQCHSGWTLEFSGYLFGPRHDHNPSEYVCVDGDAGTDHEPPWGHSGGHYLYPVMSICGTLKCPPYKSGGPLTCAVCSQ